jgi:hypothetical protein
MRLPFAHAFATVAAAALLTACDNNDIGPTADKEALKGDTQTEVVFTGGPEQPHTTLSARFLEAGKHYRVEGKLTINGDIPEKTTISVRNGELVVNGNVGAGSKLNVDVPVVTHTNSWTGPGYCYGLGFDGKIGFRYSAFCNHSETILDGLKYNDPDAAITVTGRAADDVKFSTHGAVSVRGRTVKPAIAVYSK